MKGFLLALVSPRYRKDAFKVALLVGTLLFSINHGAALLTRTMTSERWVAGLLTYVVPYCVNVQGRYAARSRLQETKADVEVAVVASLKH